MRSVAYKGDVIAQCVYGNEILEQDEEEAVIMLTLSAFRGAHMAEREMARHFGGMEEPIELETAAYWFEKAALQGNAVSQNKLAILLLTRAENILGSCVYPGYSPIPQANRWNSRSLRGGYQEGSALSSRVFEETFCSSCACC